MEQKIQIYFSGEKSESIVFMVLGILAIITALVFLFYVKRETFTGVAFPLIIIGLIQITVGVTVYFRTDDQVYELLQQVKIQPDQYIEEELPRMQKVNRAFDIYRTVEIVLIVVGIGLLFYGFHYHKHLWFGVGIGLVIQSTLMLGADFFAENRADTYTGHILNFQKDHSFTKKSI